MYKMAYPALSGFFCCLTEQIYCLLVSYIQVVVRTVNICFVFMTGHA